MILLWGPGTDSPLVAVGDALKRLGVPFAHLEQRKVLGTSVQIDGRSGLAASVRCGTQTIDLAAITAAYLRPDDSRAFAEVAATGTASPSWNRAMQVGDVLFCWADMTPAFVVSRPSAMASNGSKPYQLELIRAQGMAVPDTLVTTDPAAVLAFKDEHGEIVYKSISAVRSIVSRVSEEHMDRLADICSCPTQFQQLIDGVDYRVHVVGDQTFAARIESSADDYRYSAAHVGQAEVTPCAIPPALAATCVSLANGMGLPVAGIDLRKTGDGRWYCFEVNPSPGFTFYDRLPDEPIAEAIARLLAAAPGRRDNGRLAPADR